MSRRRPSYTPSTPEVGLRVYGADVDGNGAPGSCTDSRLAHPVGALDKAGLTSAINQFQPRGDTPIAYALKEGAKDLGRQRQTPHHLGLRRGGDLLARSLPGDP